MEVLLSSKVLNIQDYDRQLFAEVRAKKPTLRLMQGHGMPCEKCGGLIADNLFPYKHLYVTLESGYKNGETYEVCMPTAKQ